MDRKDTDLINKTILQQLQMNLNYARENIGCYSDCEDCICNLNDECIVVKVSRLNHEIGGRLKGVNIKGFGDEEEI